MPEKETTDPKAQREADDQRAQKEQAKGDLTKNPATSAVTTDLPAQQEEAPPYVEKDPLVASGLGLIKIMGIDKRYVGLPPALDEFNEMPSGLKVTNSNSTFQGLNQIPFDRSIEIKDPTTGEFYFPDESCTSWAQCEHNGVKLIPPLPEAPPEGNGGDGGASEGPEQRSFAGDGTVDLTIDEVADIGSVSAVEIEGGVYPAPAYEVADTTTIHSTDGVTPWQAGVNVLVTAIYAGGMPAATGRKKEEDAAAKKKKDDETRRKEEEEKAKAKKR
jgi:hypothetical protein